MLARLNHNSGAPHTTIQFPVVMRSAPSMTKDGTSFAGSGYTSNISLNSATTSNAGLVGDTATAAGDSTYHRVMNITGRHLRYLFSAEL